MSRSLLHLNGLRAFEAVAQCGSFGQAAKKLCVTQGAVSQQVAELERRLGVELFLRQYRSIELTEQGRRLYELVSQGFDLIERGVDEIKKQRSRVEVLRIRVFPTLAAKWLIPLLVDFHEAHNGIDVQVTTTLDDVDLDSDEADITIRRGDGHWGGVIADEMFEEVLKPVCSPRLLERSQFRTPGDLKGATLLHSLNRPVDWARWLERTGASEVDPQAGLRFGNSSLAYQAAVDGVGVAVAQDVLVSRDIQGGRLVHPFDIPVPTGNKYFLVCRRADEGKPKIAAIRGWIKNYFELNPLHSPDAQPANS